MPAFRQLRRVCCVSCVTVSIFFITKMYSWSRRNLEIVWRCAVSEKGLFFSVTGSSPGLPGELGVSIQLCLLSSAAFPHQTDVASSTVNGRGGTPPFA